MNLDEALNELLKNKNFKDEYFDIDLKKEIALDVFEARLKEGITQEELAKRVGTKQPSIARVENGTNLPSIRFLEKIATALKTRLLPPRFESLLPEKYESSSGFESVNDSIDEKLDAVGISYETPTEESLINIGEITND